MIYLWGIVLSGFLLALSAFDIREFRLPNVLTFPLIALGLIHSYLASELMAALIGASLGYLAFVGIAYAFKRLRGVDGLGRGDAKLLAAGGAWVGWMGLPHIVIIASSLAIAGVILMRLRGSEITSKSPVPFGPFLAVGIAISWGVKNILI